VLKENAHLSGALVTAPGDRPAADRNEPFILPSSKYHHVRELLKRGLNFCHTLINIVQLNAHAVIGTRTCDHDTKRGEHVTVVDRGIEQRF